MCSQLTSTAITPCSWERERGAFCDGGFSCKRLLFLELAFGKGKREERAVFILSIYSYQSCSKVLRLEDKFLRGPIPRRPPVPACRKHRVRADGSAAPMAASREGSVEVMRVWWVTKRPPPCLQVPRLLRCSGRRGRGRAQCWHFSCRSSC